MIEAFVGLIPMGAPAELRARIYAAFQVYALYRAPQRQATITDQTPQIIQALISDPRTDHDTAHPERTNPPVAAMCTIFLRDHGGRGGEDAAGGW